MALVVYSRMRVFPLEVYPVDSTKPVLCSLGTNKRSACISKFKTGTYLFLCIKKRNIVVRRQSKNTGSASDSGPLRLHLDCTALGATLESGGVSTSPAPGVPCRNPLHYFLPCSLPRSVAHGWEQSLALVPWKRR